MIICLARSTAAMSCAGTSSLSCPPRTMTSAASCPSISTLQSRLIKIGARITEAARRAPTAFAAACPEAVLFSGLVRSLPPAGPQPRDGPPRPARNSHQHCRATEYDGLGSRQGYCCHSPCPARHQIAVTRLARPAINMQKRATTDPAPTRRRGITQSVGRAIWPWRINEALSRLVTRTRIGAMDTNVETYPRWLAKIATVTC